MSIYYSDDSVTLHHGDALEVLRDLECDSMDAVVTDPPYGLEFMGKEWDAPWRASGVGRGVRVAAERADELTERGRGHSTSAGPYLASGVDSIRIAGRPFQEWCEAWSRECLRILKPGGHLLAFGGTRTWHRLVCAVEDAGFEIRDSIAWLYGSGFPKSLDVSKAIDKAAGHWRGRAGAIGTTNASMAGPNYERTEKGDPVTSAAADWQGWGTALKPAFEPIVVARKPLAGTVAANVLEHGTGALNIDATRVSTNGERVAVPQSNPENRDPSSYAVLSDRERFQQMQRESIERTNTLGRWPANVVLDESQAEVLDEQSGELTSGANPTRRGSDKFRDAYGDFKGQEECIAHRGADIGGASRFFYVAKANSGERPRVNGTAHPTVKPLSLMRWLVRLVTPPRGTVLDPFAGSGTTLEACVIEGFRCIGVEKSEEYLPLIEARLRNDIQPVLDLNFEEGA